MTTQPPDHAAATPEGTVTVAETGAGTYTQEIIAGGHRLIADEPRLLATTPDRRPTTSCCPRWCVYVDDGADVPTRSGLPLEQVRVSLRHSRIHAQDCADCETKQGMVDHIDRDIELIGDLIRMLNGAALHRRTLSRAPDADVVGARLHDVAAGLNSPSE